MSDVKDSKSNGITQVRFGGVGGQGIVLAGRLLGTAAALGAGLVSSGATSLSTVACRASTRAVRSSAVLAAAVVSSTAGMTVTVTSSSLSSRSSLPSPLGLDRMVW